MLSPTVLLEQVTVLVVDDEEPLRRYITRVMEDAGYQVLTARDGFEGLALLEQSRSHVRLVVTDVSMPRMTVPELAARVPPSHTRYPCSSCPVIVAHRSTRSPPRETVLTTRAEHAGILGTPQQSRALLRWARGSVS